MQTYQHPLNIKYAQAQHGPSLFSKFLNWSSEQEKYSLGWLAATLTLHGCILAPLTLLLVSMGGLSIILFGAVIVAMAMTLVTNLAAMPTRITVPVFFLSLLIDVVVIVVAIFRLVA